MTLSDGVTMDACPASELGKLTLVTKRDEYAYFAAAVIIWVATWIATASALDDSAFDDMVPILGGATFFFLVIIPAGLFHRPRQRTTRQASGEPDERGPSPTGARPER